jgi:hypothetical protein
MAVPRCDLAAPSLNERSVNLDAALQRSSKLPIARKAFAVVNAA